MYNGVDLGPTDTFSKFFASEQSTKPQDVADAIARLVETPAGKRPLRTVCGPDYGTIAINQHTAPIQAEVLRACNGAKGSRGVMP
jgi:hypothetical protein